MPAAGAVSIRPPGVDSPHPTRPHDTPLSAGAGWFRPVPSILLIGYARVQARLRLLADGRPAEGHRSASPRASRRASACTTLLGATGTGKTMTMAGDDRGGAAPVAGDRPQQDARGPALQRVPDVLPEQLGRVLRLLLRLLPARGLRPVEGPLHREGLGDQQGDRPPAPRRHGGAVRAPRRRDRGLGVVHLRPRLAGDLQRQLPGAGEGRHGRPRRAAAQARLAAVQPQRPGAGARHVPRARGHARGLPRLRGDGVPGACCSATRSSACSTSTR